MTTPSPDRRNIEAAREVALQFRALTGIGDDPDPAAAWTDTLAELIAALHHLADEEVGEGGFAVCLERAAFNYAYALRPDEEEGALPDDHPFRWGYEGMLVSWQKQPHVLTDEHRVFGHPYIPNPHGPGYVPDPDWHPRDEDAVRSERNPWRDDPHAWQPPRRLI